MEKRELTCIGCPLGCAITVTLEGSEVKEVVGFTCKRGKEYACKEVTNPTRIVTSTVRLTGSKTGAAVRQFQRLNGLTVDGAVGTNTWDALYQNWASRHGEGEIWPGIPMRTGQSGATVKSAQQRLQSLVPELVADGHYGPRTREAVLAWQVVHDLTPDGILGRRTWTSLYSHTAA